MLLIKLLSAQLGKPLLLVVIERFRPVILTLLLFSVIDSSFCLVGHNGLVSSSYAQEGNLNPEFSKPINLSNNPKDSVYAQVASDGDNVYVVWQENDPTPQVKSGRQDNIQTNTSYFKNNNNYNTRNYDILLMKSIDGGRSFGKEINLSNNPGFSEHPQIAVSDDIVHVAWVDDSNSTGKEILYRKSVDGGKTFSEIINLSPDGNLQRDSDNLEIAAKGNNVYTVWQESTPQLLDIGILSRNATVDTTLMKDNSSIVLRASSDGGNKFREPLLLSNNVLKSYPKIAVSENGNIYVVWNVGIIGEEGSTALNGEINNNTNKETDHGIFFTRSLDYGNSFESLIKLSSAGQSIGESQVTSRDNHVYVVWGGNPDEKVVGDLYISESIDDGKNFSSPIAVEKGNTLNVEVATNRHNNVFVAWQAELADGNEEIYLKKSSIQGINFHDRPKNISTNDGISECTSISVADDGTVYLAWEDDAFGNHEILFSRTI